VLGLTEEEEEEKKKKIEEEEAKKTKKSKTKRGGWRPAQFAAGAPSLTWPPGPGSTAS
jgi:hypothetical protein